MSIKIYGQSGREDEGKETIQTGSTSIITPNVKILSSTPNFSYFEAPNDDAAIECPSSKYIYSFQQIGLPSKIPENNNGSTLDISGYWEDDMGQKVLIEKKEEGYKIGHTTIHKIGINKYDGAKIGLEIRDSTTICILEYQPQDKLSYNIVKLKRSDISSSFRFSKGNNGLLYHINSKFNLITLFSEIPIALTNLGAGFEVHYGKGELDELKHSIYLAGMRLSYHLPLGRQVDPYLGAIFFDRWEKLIDINKGNSESLRSKFGFDYFVGLRLFFSKRLGVCSEFKGWNSTILAGLSYRF